MPLSVSEDIKQEDHGPIFEINYKAFYDDIPIRCLSPGGLDSAAYGSNVARFANAHGLRDPTRLRAEVVDDETGQVVAFTSMTISEDNPFVECSNAEVSMPFVDEDDRPWIEWLFSSLERRRAAIPEVQTPGPFGYLAALGTHPDHQRRGAATLLLEWAIRKLDEKRTPCLLQARGNVTKYGMYQKHGFRVVDEPVFVDSEKFPGREPIDLAIMVREQKTV